MNGIEEIKSQNYGKVILNAKLKDYTTYQSEGIVDAIVFPKTVEDLIHVLDILKRNQIKHKLLGNGSNLIFNNHYDGVLIKLEELNHLHIEGTKVTVGAGYPVMKLSLKVSRMGLSGLEFASGIPGTVGGAIFMNAGAYKSDMGYITKKVKVLTPELKVITMNNSEMDFHYRTSFLQKNPEYVCIEAELELVHGDRDIIMDIIRDRKKRRLETQPLEYPSAGSVFRNPPDDYAGRLIEAVGYKGKNIGGAEVSSKHANFIVNKAHASGEDIKTLILEIQDKVKEEMGIMLKIEQEFVE